MPTKSQLVASTVYANLLEEVNLRVAAINHCTMNRSGLAPPFVKDFCFLQIRMICELIALGCLVAHGDIEKTASKIMQTEWSASKIMDALERLHPHFYPQPVKQTQTPTGFHLEVIDPSPLPKDEFLKIYYKCGDALHRGNVQKLIKGQFPVQINYPDITEKAQKLVDLMSSHIVVMHSGEQMFLAMLRNIQDGKAQVAIAETPAGQPVDFANPNFLKDAYQAI